MICKSKWAYGVHLSDELGPSATTFLIRNSCFIIRKRIAAIVILASLLTLSSTYAQTTDFFELVKSGTPQSVQVAIDNGAEILARDGKYGPTPLMYAAESNPNPEVITVLLEAGADVNEKCRGQGSVLRFAAESNPNPKVITVLLEAGADVNERSFSGYTPLMNAAGCNPNPEVITVLLKAGANVEDRDTDGWTPLMYAARYNQNSEVIMVLLMAGADAKLISNQGRTAFEYARENKQLIDTDAYRLLQESSK